MTLFSTYLLNNENYNSVSETCISIDYDLIPLNAWVKLSPGLGLTLIGQTLWLSTFDNINNIVSKSNNNNTSTNDDKSFSNDNSDRSYD